MTERGHGPTGWQVPESVHLTSGQDRLVWRMGRSGRTRQPAAGPRGVNANRGPLAGFVDLARPGLSPERFVVFGKRWGVFGSEPVPWWPSRRRVGSAPCRPQGLRLEPSAGEDRIDRWQQLARFFAATLAVAKASRESKPATDADAETIEVELDLERKLVADLARHGIKRGPRRAVPGGGNSSVCLLLAARAIGQAVRLQWSGEQTASGGLALEAHFGGGSLLAGLAAELVLEVSRSAGFVVCAACGQSFLPHRVQAGRRSYCRPCRSTGASRRDASRDYRTRHKNV